MKTLKRVYFVNCWTPKDNKDRGHASGNVQGVVLFLNIAEVGLLWAYLHYN